MTDEDLNALLAQLDFHIGRYRGDYDEHVAALMTRAAQLRSLGGWLAQRMPRWWDDLDRARQVWVGRSAGAPVEGQFTVDLSPFGDETPKPRQAFWTCTQTSTVSPWLDSPEKLSRGPETMWRITVLQAARVVEIHSPAAWSALVRSYPRAEAGYTFTGEPYRPESSARVDPDWSKIAHDWDGVHLSIGGWLTAEDVSYESAGAISELRGWNMESTVWLRWAFASVAPLSLEV